MALFKAFGKNPSGKQLEILSKSPHYRNGIFNNISETPLSGENAGFFKIMWKILNKPKNTIPPGPLPTVKSDLNNLDPDHPVIIWFGHSSYLIYLNGKNILVDPVFSGHASPFAIFSKSFAGTNVYNVEDLPQIDILLLTHDHYDHLDYQTLRQIDSKTCLICTSLGVASHLTYWGINEKKIIEFDWWDERQLTSDIKLTATPARHFSGRAFQRFKTLWSSFILQSPSHTLFIGADSGYDTHFKLIGSRFGPFDIAILECGQYNDAWKYIHMMPEETSQAAVDLRAKWLMPVHWGKFSLSLHPWDEPIKRVAARTREQQVNMTTPRIGEPVILDKSYPDSEWWLL